VGGITGDELNNPETVFFQTMNSEESENKATNKESQTFEEIFFA